MMRKISCRLFTYSNVIRTILRWLYKIPWFGICDGEALLSPVCLKARFTETRKAISET